MNKKQKITSAVCPECDTPLLIKNNSTAGAIIGCGACGTESEIISLSPFQLAPLEEEK